MGSEAFINSAFVIILLSIFSRFPVSETAQASFQQRDLKHLYPIFKTDYWTQNRLTRLFTHPKTRKLQEIYSLNMQQPLVLSDKKYQNFSQIYALQRAKNFSRKWKQVLEKAERNYHVDHEILTAILLVETSFGRFTGDHQLPSVFLTVYFETRDRMLQAPSPSQVAKKRLLKKNVWALNELKSLLKMEEFHGFSIAKMKGSYAGAFGICQFLPSSFLKWAVTSKRGKVPDLFSHEDAIHSVANYLRQNGYKSNASKEKRDKAIWIYNNSLVYVRTINQVAASLQIKALSR